MEGLEERPVLMRRRSLRSLATLRLVLGREDAREPDIALRQHTLCQGQQLLQLLNSNIPASSCTCSARVCANLAGQTSGSTVSAWMNEACHAI